MSIVKSKFWDSLPVRVFIHLAAWAFLLFFPFLFMNSVDAERNFPRFLFNTSGMAVFYYFNSFVFIPKILAKGRVVQFATVIILSLGILMAAVYTYEQFNPTPPPPKPMPNEKPRDNSIKHLSFTFFTGLMIFGISTSATITGEWFRNEKQKKEMENQKLLAELAFLKAQVNPHFLFNMLNNIYTLAYKKSDTTADAVLKLSHLMRYMIYESNVPLISLEKEIDYLQNYIDLQRIRLSHDMDVLFDIEGEIEGKMIAPMLLVPFVENAFKHGVSYVERQPISINLKIRQDKWLYLEVENHIHKTSNKSGIKDSGIGLQNTRRRLELLYPDKHDLKIEEDEETYKVSLLINMN